MHTRRLAALVAVVVSCVSVARAEDIVEKFDDGTTKVRYKTDGEGRKAGGYVEYFPGGGIHIRANYLRGQLQGEYVEHYPGGKVKLKANYRDGLLNGPYQSHHESGKVHIRTTYAAGKLNGTYAEVDAEGKTVAEQIYFDGLLLYARSTRMIKEMLKEILGDADFGPRLVPFGRGFRTTERPAKPDAPAPGASVNDVELRRLNAYRYLCGVPCDVTLKPEYNDYAQAAADLCARIGRLDHRPSNPGISDEAFKKARTGTEHSNLAQAFGTPGSVRGYMDDSDESNITCVGHRRWCLNPAMLQCGFGQNGSFSALYAHDVARRNVPDYDHVAFPPAGFVPNDCFGAHCAWHVSLNPARYRNPSKGEVKVNVYPLSGAGKDKIPSPDKRGPALALDFFNVDLSGCGIPNAIIFRPQGVSDRDGSAYWVEIKGLKKADGSDAVLEYVVHFVDL
jgi:hypothetical protein